MAKICTSIIIRHTQNPRFTRPENHNDRIFAYPSLNSHQKSLLINTRARFRSILMPVLLLDPHPSLPADYYDSLSHWNWYRKERQKKNCTEWYADLYFGISASYASIADSTFEEEFFRGRTFAHQLITCCTLSIIQNLIWVYANAFEWVMIIRVGSLLIAEVSHLAIGSVRRDRINASPSTGPGSFLWIKGLGDRKNRQKKRR